jgi:hypothetical protein
MQLSSILHRARIYFMQDVSPAKFVHSLAFALRYLQPQRLVLFYCWRLLFSSLTRRSDLILLSRASATILSDRPRNHHTVLDIPLETHALGIYFLIRWRLVHFLLLVDFLFFSVF